MTLIAMATTTKKTKTIRVYWDEWYTWFFTEPSKDLGKQFQVLIDVPEDLSKRYERSLKAHNKIREELAAMFPKELSR